MDLASDDDDARVTELETLEAIYPELRRPDAHGFTFELELPVEPPAPVTVTFPAASSEQVEAQKQALSKGSTSTAPVIVEDSLQVSHLPPLSLRITLPDGYPTKCAPLIKISTTPQWLSAETLARLEEEGPRLWEEMGRDLVAYAYIDHVQRAADDVFGAITAESTLEVNPEHKLAVLDYDIKAKKAAFDKETFQCGICLDPKKGSKCHKMLDCDHIFCLQCLQDFYNDAIKDGNLATVRCLAPNCAKERESAASTAKVGKARKFKTFINPSELLQMGLPEDMVRRYVNLKYKTELESDKNTIYCPRQWCNSAARSKKHKKPSGLEFGEASDAESDEDGGGAADEKGKKKKAEQFNTADLLAVCEDCGLAFCSRCYQSWHGEYARCTPKRNDGELTEEEKASLEYMKLHTSPCPTCNAPAQKTHGCNHMICSRCQSHFCYLCSAWLDPGNPYQHYNQQPDGKVTSCYMRLWELEGGDGDDVGLGFAGGLRAAAVEALEVEEVEPGVGQGVVDDLPAPLILDPGIELQGAGINGLQREGAENSDSEADDNNAAREHGEQVQVAREAPLVLRLMDNNNNRGRGGRRGADQPGQAANRPRAGAAAAAQAQNRAGQALNARGNPGAQQAGRARGGRGARRPRDGGRARGAAAAVGRGGHGGDAGLGRPNQIQRHAENQQQQNDQHPAPNDDDALDPLQEAWVRHFVQMALMDAEDEVEGSESDEDNDRWVIR